MELLKKLYSIHSMSGQEGAMRKFVKNYVKGMPGDITLRQDYGNIYITKGDAETYPCLVAHLDQVQRLHSPDFRVFETEGCLFGYSLQNRRVEGLGADDKNGIWIALKCLEKLPVLKVALFKEEEIGCGGSSIADLDFFKDCRYCLQADRRNGGDLITDIGGAICSEDFIKDIQPLMDRHGYKKTSGLMTDVETLVDSGIGISCVNLSCGYYDPHTDHEYTKINELYNALAFVWGIVKTLDKVYPHVKPKPDYSKWYDHYMWPGYRSGGYYRHLNEVQVPPLADYANEWDWLEDIVYLNLEADPEEVYPFISADWEDTLGFTKLEFLDIWHKAIDDLYYGGEVEDEDDEISTAYAG